MQMQTITNQSRKTFESWKNLKITYHRNKRQLIWAIANNYQIRKVKKTKHLMITTTMKAKSTLPLCCKVRLLRFSLRISLIWRIEWSRYNIGWLRMKIKPKNLNKKCKGWKLKISSLVLMLGCLPMIKVRYFKQSKY